MLNGKLYSGLILASLRCLVNNTRVSMIAKPMGESVGATRKSVLRIISVVLVG